MGRVLHGSFVYLLGMTLSLASVLFYSGFRSSRVHSQEANSSQEGEPETGQMADAGGDFLDR